MNEQITYIEVPMLIRLATREDITELRYVASDSGYVREEYKNLYRLKPNVCYLIKDLDSGGFKNYCRVTGLHTDKAEIRDLFKKELLYVVANDLENNIAFAKAKRGYVKE